MPYSESQIIQKIDDCPKLPSLKSLNENLSNLLSSDQSLTYQIAEVIRRDPSLSARILQLVNSVFFGLSRRVSSLEDAIFYMGLRQIKELALATPIIEDLSKIDKGFQLVDWRKMWQHSIGTAIMAREISGAASLNYSNDVDYMSGLLHNVGKIIMARAFPREFSRICSTDFSSLSEMCVFEEKEIGWDYSKIGAYYLSEHGLSRDITGAIACHNSPNSGGDSAPLGAVIQVSREMVQSIGVRYLNNLGSGGKEQWDHCSGWVLLFGDSVSTDLGVASLKHSLSKLPAILSGML